MVERVTSFSWPALSLSFLKAFFNMMDRHGFLNSVTFLILMNFLACFGEQLVLERQKSSFSDGIRRGNKTSRDYYRNLEGLAASYYINDDDI